MPLDMMPFDELVATWGSAPSKGMVVDIAAVSSGLLAGGSAPQAIDASKQLAMLFGDTGAPELCIVMVTHRQRCGLPATAHAALESHRRLALLDLGIASSPKATIPLASVVDSTAVDSDGEAALLSAFLAPVGGSLDEAVEVAIRLVAVRAGLLPRPDPLTLEALRALPHPATRPPDR